MSLGLNRKLFVMMMRRSTLMSSMLRNYPCCTVNHPQAYPKFWSHSFMADKSDNSLVHVFLGPATFSGTLGRSNHVQGM